MLINMKELARMLGVSRVTIWNWVKNGTLPQPIRITRRILGWKPETIEAWLESRKG